MLPVVSVVTLIGIRFFSLWVSVSWYFRFAARIRFPPRLGLSRGFGTGSGLCGCGGGVLAFARD
jgi:hypothetical protein